MSKREPIKTSIKEIVDYWSQHQDESGLSVDWAEAHERCWRCGCKKNLERAHIIPHAMGGKDEPSNLVLLCKRCHADGPNVDDPEIMWDWIRAYGVPFYNTFWGILGRKEYQFIYGHSVPEELEKNFTYVSPEMGKEELEHMVREKFEDAMDRSSNHFGQPYCNTATMAGVHRMLLKDIAKELGVAFPIKSEKEKKEMPWWLG